MLLQKNINDARRAIWVSMHNHANLKNRTLHCTWMNHKKSLDSNFWQMNILEICETHPKIITFLKDIMSHWKTTLCSKSLQNKVTSKETVVKEVNYFLVLGILYSICQLDQTNFFLLNFYFYSLFTRLIWFLILHRTFANQYTFYDCLRVISFLTFNKDGYFKFEIRILRRRCKRV